MPWRVVKLERMHAVLQRRNEAALIVFRERELRMRMQRELIVTDVQGTRQYLLR